MDRFHDVLDAVGSSSPVSKKAFRYPFQKRVKINWWGGPEFEKSSERV